MNVWDLLFTASVPSLEVLIVTGLGSFIAWDYVGILSEEARNYMNKVVFYVFNPALVGSNLADTVTASSLVAMWFMPINLLLTYIVGSALGWILLKITRAPPHVYSIILGVCSAGNVGNLLIIIVPAICEESGNPFGDSTTCSKNGLAYASLSMAIGAIYIWTYVYNIMRITVAVPPPANINGSRIYLEFAGEASEVPEESHTEALLAYVSDENVEVPFRVKCMKKLKTFAEKINLKNIFAPSTCGAVILIILIFFVLFLLWLAGFFVGLIPPVRDLIIGDSAPLQVIEKSAALVGEGAIPTITLIIGGNLLKGLKGNGGMKKRLIIGVLVVRFVLLPVVGIGVVKGAERLGFVKADALYQFVLMLQFALPPATNISTITQLFKSGEKECAVLMLWTYVLAAFAITLWATLFMILVS